MNLYFFIFLLKTIATFRARAPSIYGAASNNIYANVIHVSSGSAICMYIDQFLRNVAYSLNVVGPDLCLLHFLEVEFRSAPATS